MKNLGLLVLALLVLLSARCVSAQTENATITGRVTDTTKAVIVGAQVTAISTGTNVRYEGITNNAGSYLIAAIPPGSYRIEVGKTGFKTIVETGTVLHVQDTLELNFEMAIGSVTESVTVEAGGLVINTTDASVSTVVDRQFAENLPMNGRSFQTLIDLTPGVVPTAGNALDSGQFSVNGQRASSNYWMVDGVSANVGSSTEFGGNHAAGAVGTSSVLGGTNSLVSVDALQEFRIQTSTFAPEFGRTPGAQISIVTRSGGKQFHGSAFDYLRNDIFDASNWFNGYINNPPLPKAQERQNDFGGTFSGPILKDRMFFFFSYEGLRLRLPTTALSQVPDLTARQSAVPAIQPYLNAFPFDPHQPDLGNGVAQFNKTYSDPATLDAYSLRIDHRLTEKITLFGRYNYSPSESLQRALFQTALSSVFSSRISTQQATIGSTWTVSAHSVNELRVNYSRSDASGHAFLDNFGGAVPLPTLPFPSPYTARNARLFFNIVSLTNGSFLDGALVGNLQRQVNLVDNTSVQKGSHNLKFGVDYRRLSPVYAPFRYGQLASFSDVSHAETGNLRDSVIESNIGTTLLFNNLSAFVQDTWHVHPRLVIAYGVRWDTDFAPSSTAGPNLPAASGFNLSDLSQLALAPAGTPPFKTTYGNFAPRVGVSYQLSKRQDWGTVARGGLGLFYDLASSEAGNVILDSGYPFTLPFSRKRGGTFPIDPSAAVPPPIEPPTAANRGTLAAFDPNLRLPYTLQWNVALEQGLGRQQSLSISYVGSNGQRLIQTAQVLDPSPSIHRAFLVTNSATSDYNAFQLQFQRRLLKGLQVLASHTWSHSIDTGSAGSISVGSNLPTSATRQHENRGPSDFDIRNAFSAAVTYAIPAPKSYPFVKVITGGWSLQSIIQAHSAPPIEILNGNFSQLANGFNSDIRPDVTQGIPFYLYGRQYPGGVAINNTPGAVVGGCSDGSQSIGPFCPPPVDTNGNPLRQGNLGRNALRGFGVTQWDFAVHRDFPIRESLTLQFRAEMFNVLNHPNFGAEQGDLSVSPFGVSTQMLGQFLSGGNVGTGSFSPLYQIGGPRSMQFALKLSF